METAKYWVHVIYPHDEDQGPDCKTPIRIIVSKPAKERQSHPDNGWEGNGTFVFRDKEGKTLVLNQEYKNGRMVKIRGTSYNPTGWYHLYSLKSQDPGFQLGGEELTLWDIDTGLPEVFEFVNSGRGPEFLFGRNPDGTLKFIDGWNRIHPDVYHGNFCKRVEEKQDAYAFGYQRHVRPIPTEFVVEKIFS